MNIVVDESLILYKGRLLFRQYIASKRARYGIKLYILCESSSGYVYSLRVYTGKDSTLNPVGCPPTLGVTGKIVWELVQPLLHKGYNLYVDNFYTGVELFSELYKAGTVACGTVRCNRKGFPQELVCKKLHKSQSTALRSNELLAVKFLDRRDVYVLTRIHDESTSPITVWGQMAEVHKPICVLDFNKYLGGVDKNDQVLQPYNACRKTCTWYKKLFTHLIKMATYNAYVVYHQTTTGRLMTFLDFQLSVIESLTAVTEEAAASTSYVLEDVARLQERHFADRIPKTPKKDRPCSRCKVCLKHGKRQESRYYCPQCPSQPGLCIPTCFTLYHTKAKFWEID
ncbi:hypothetical protein NDU88_007014 [Pleurodeles waltl]|uniref:PiggyBac transposable element-derived protein domain-containing protein n=1 Tax=Pleurodeles waltl TaxID=8319 RepID=A0AAV7RQF7_PLEWA|nr:hypothetical protein NDU88_007014 [Pleurodeles waltl]